MHNYTEGNSPSLRAQLGVGWNRALPAPFSFGNGILPDGVNDYLEVPSMNTKRWSDLKLWTLEFWCHPSAIPVSQCIGCFTFADNGSLLINGGNFTTINGVFTFRNQLVSGSFSFPNTNKHHVVVIFDYANNIALSYLNGAIFSLTNGASLAQATMDTNNPLMNHFRFLSREGASEFMNKLIDEVRFYNRVLSVDEITQNYNAGVGNNPAKTEGLQIWYDFEGAESESSLWPGGSPTGWTSGAWGLRDKSGQNNHAMQVNMANNATLGGTLQAF